MSQERSIERPKPTIVTPPDGHVGTGFFATTTEVLVSTEELVVSAITSAELATVFGTEVVESSVRTMVVGETMTPSAAIANCESAACT